MAKEENKEITQTGGEIADFSQFSGASGFEDTDATTFKTPFLKILQDLSPECKPRGEQAVEGAAAGMLFNTATQELHESMDVVVLKISHVLTVWQPNRGGFVGRHPLSAENTVVAKKEGLKKWDSEGNEVIDTLEFYCLDANDPSSVFILTMTTSSLKHGKSWATRLRMLKVNGKPTGVSWASVWTIGTVEEKNDKGSWFSIGTSPKFKRVITMEEKTSYIDPALEMLKTAETAYSEVSPESEATTESSDY